MGEKTLWTLNQEINVMGEELKGSVREKWKGLFGLRRKIIDSDRF